MSDVSAAGATPAKPALSSMTIQGAITMIVSALAPTLAGYLGVDSHQLIDVISAIATIAGFTMTVIGRMRAKHQLT